ncbi:hypothetical protein ACIRL2_42490 [Embleya sp. NPDC127516]|uniref:hypothetical protein n=1 Tax=Embleya sp. NPDC127516 TaxID=3363990 RepID=UPI00381F243D
MTTTTKPDTEGKFAFLKPLFDAVAAHHGPDAYIPLPEPAPRSSLATDDRPLGGWTASTLIRNSFAAGLSHVDALARQITVARVIDPHSPWTLLRGALENFATSTWLLAGTGRDERRTRALASWAQDMHNRGQYEDDTGHTPTGPNARTGTQRRDEIHALATTLGLSPLPRPEVRKIIESAASETGLDPAAVRAAWRVGSGFAHGRHWPLVRVGAPVGAIANNNGHMVALVLDEEHLANLTTPVLTLLNHTRTRYTVRAT